MGYTNRKMTTDIKLINVQKYYKNINLPKNDINNQKDISFIT